MTAIGELMEKLAAKAETTEPYARIVYGSDPPENGICMIQNAGYGAERHLDAAEVYRLPVLLNGKHAQQETLLEALWKIHEALTMTSDYTDLMTDDLQVMAIMTTSGPTIIGREQNNQWIAGSSFEVSFYWR